MKKFLKIFGIVLLLALIGGWIYWQQNKKRIIRNMIENKVSGGTDSLYFIHYDSSSIDEIAGNASFYQVDLQSDSLQKQLLQYDTAAAPTVYNIHIDEFSVTGVNTAALLSNTAVDAKEIRVVRPVIYIIKAGKREKKTISVDEQDALYKRILGKYNNIKAASIVIENGNIYFADKSGKAHTSLIGINIAFKNFSINSSKDYQNLPSYFIKDVVAKIKEVNLVSENRQTVLTEVEYNAPGKFIYLKKLHQKDDKGQLIHDINNTYITNIATDSFILHQQVKAQELSSEGGTLTFFVKPAQAASAATPGADQVEMDPNYFDEAVLDKIKLGSTRIRIVNPAKPGDAPLELLNVKFEASDIQKLSSGTSIKNVVGRSNWIVSADGFSLMSADKRYQLKAGKFSINRADGTIRMNSFSVTPQITEEAFAKMLQYQDDLYNMSFSNIVLTGVNTGKLITQRRLEAETATLQPTLKVFNDRTVTPSPISKVGKYPQQLLQKVKLPVLVKKLVINNGYIAYKERGAASKKTGTVLFTKVNGTVTNVTNIKEVIAQNNVMEVNATASFMGVGALNTNWKLKLGDPNGAFSASGSMGGLDVTSLNTITEPLGMASLKKGRVNKLTFSLTGTDYKAQGTSTLLYDGLKINILKGGPEMEKAGGISFLANLLIKDSNPKNGVTRSNTIDYDRDVNKSFFNLLWKSIFAAAKKTTAGKDTNK